MNRTLLIIIVLYLVWRVLHSYGRRVAERNRGADEFSRFSGRRKGHGAAGEEPLASVDLAECAGCGVLVPRERLSRSESGALFCSDSCRATASEGEDRAHNA